MTLSCTKDIDFVNKAGSSGSFAYWRILDANLDTNSLVFENGAQCFGCTLNFHFNNGGGTIIHTVNSNSGVVNSHINIYGEGTGTGCVPYNLAASTYFEGSGMVRMANCTGSPTLGSGAWWWVSGQSEPTDSTPILPASGAYPSATYTIFPFTADRADLGSPASAFFAASNPGVGWDVYGVWFLNATHPNLNCFPLTSGVTTGTTTDIELCEDGMVKFLNGPTFAQLSLSPDSTAPNGSLTYCSNCKNVVDDSATAGAACLGSGSGAFAKRENSRWDCN